MLPFQSLFVRGARVLLLVTLSSPFRNPISLQGVFGQRSGTHQQTKMSEAPANRRGAREIPSWVSATVLQHISRLRDVPAGVQRRRLLYLIFPSSSPFRRELVWESNRRKCGFSVVSTQKPAASAPFSYY